MSGMFFFETHCRIFYEWPVSLYLIAAIMFELGPKGRTYIITVIQVVVLNGPVLFCWSDQSGQAWPSFFTDRPGLAILASILYQRPKRFNWFGHGPPFCHAHFAHFSYLLKWRHEAMCKVKSLFFS